MTKRFKCCLWLLMSLTNVRRFMQKGSCLSSWQLILKNFETTPRSRSRKGEGCTHLYKRFRYVSPQEVWLLNCSGVKMSMDFNHFGLKVWKRIYRNSLKMGMDLKGEVWKITSFGLKQGQVWRTGWQSSNQTFRRVPPGGRNMHEREKNDSMEIPDGWDFLVVQLSVFWIAHYQFSCLVVLPENISSSVGCKARQS